MIYNVIHRPSDLSPRTTTLKRASVSYTAVDEGELTFSADSFIKEIREVRRNTKYVAESDYLLQLLETTSGMKIFYRNSNFHNCRAFKAKV